MATHHVIPPRTYLQVFAVLIGLTVVTIGLDLLVKYQFLHIPFQNELSLLIAVVKASLVLLFFMHVYYSTRLTWVVALSSLLWLGILIAYTLTDYWTREMIRVPGH